MYDLGVAVAREAMQASSLPCFQTVHARILPFQWVSVGYSLHPSSKEKIENKYGIKRIGLK